VTYIISITPIVFYRKKYLVEVRGASFLRSSVRHTVGTLAELEHETHFLDRGRVDPTICVSLSLSYQHGELQSSSSYSSLFCGHFRVSLLLLLLLMLYLISMRLSLFRWRRKLIHRSNPELELGVVTSWYIFTQRKTKENDFAFSLMIDSQWISRATFA
jgi:hypothetical protein